MSGHAPGRSGSSEANVDVTRTSPKPRKASWGSATTKLGSSWSAMGFCTLPPLPGLRRGLDGDRRRTAPAPAAESRYRQIAYRGTRWCSRASAPVHPGRGSVGCFLSTAVVIGWGPPSGRLPGVSRPPACAPGSLPEVFPAAGGKLVGCALGMRNQHAARPGDSADLGQSDSTDPARDPFAGRHGEEQFVILSPV